MARCEGTTRNGDQCKRDARPDSKFCYTHGAAEGETDATAEEEQSEVILEFGGGGRQKHRPHAGAYRTLPC